MLSRRRIKYTLRSNYVSKYLATQLTYYEISSKSSKLRNIMRVEILTLNFSIKDNLKIVSKTKTKNRYSTIYYIDYRDYIVHKLRSKFRIHKSCV